MPRDRRFGPRVGGGGLGREVECGVGPRQQPIERDAVGVALARPREADPARRAVAAHNAQQEPVALALSRIACGSSRRAAAVVVRPDRYVYGITSDAAALNRQIAAIGAQLFG